MTNLRVIEPEGLGEGVETALESVLGMARAGRLSSVAIAYVEREGTTGQCISDLPHRAAQIGSVAIMLSHLTIGSLGIQ